MRRSAVLIVLSLVLAACANEPRVGPASGDPEPTLDQTRLGVYERLARELAGAEEIGWREIVIVSRLCENAGAAEEQEGCDDALTMEEQDELARRLADLGPPIRFVEDPTPLFDEEWISGTPEIVVLRMGTIEERGDGVSVGGSYLCGGLCASGTTYLLEETADGWEVVGTSGSTWIA